MPEKGLVETEEQKILVKIFAEHLPYEIDTMRKSYRRLTRFAQSIATDKLTPDQEFNCNSLIEVFCVHARALLYFFSNDKKNDDAIAKDFADMPPFKPTKSIRKKLNKQIFNLTKKRAIVYSEKFKISDAKDVLEIIEHAIKTFVDLRPDLKCETSPITKDELATATSILAPGPASATTYDSRDRLPVVNWRPRSDS